MEGSAGGVDERMEAVRETVKIGVARVLCFCPHVCRNCNAIVGRVLWRGICLGFE